MAALRRAAYHRHPVPAAPRHRHAVVHIAAAGDAALVAADAVPALDEHVHDARHVEAVALAAAPVRPAPPPVPAPVARRRRLRVQVQPRSAAAAGGGAAAASRTWERGAAGWRSKAAGAAVVDEAGDVAAAGVAVARPRRAGAARGRRRRSAGRTGGGAAAAAGTAERALAVEVVVAAGERAAEARADADLAAPVAPERRFGVLQPQPVVRVAEVHHLAVPHPRRRRRRRRASCRVSRGGTILPLRVRVRM